MSAFEIILCHPKRQILICLWVCCILFACINCNQPVKQPSDSASKVTSEYIGDERIFFLDYNGMPAAYLIFLPLVALVGDEYGEPQPVLAEHWEHSEDYKVWKFRLRKNVRWHDGEPVTAHDIKFTMDIRQNHELTGSEEEFYSVEVLDDYNWTVTHKKPFSGLDTYNVYYPKHLLEHLDPKDFYNWDFWAKPVGNGPYRYVRHVPKTMVEVEANPDYYKGKPRIERVVLKFAQHTSLTELLSGNVDALNFVERDILLKLKKDERFREYHRWGTRMQTILWNHSNPLFSNREIRKALTMAINRPELAEVLNYPEDVPLLDVMITRNLFVNGQFPEALHYNPELAREQLNKMGWTDSDRNGILDKGGMEFRFTTIANSSHRKMAVYIQDQFRKIGVRMEIQILETVTVWNQLNAGEFEAAISEFENPELQSIGHTWYFKEDSPLGYSNPQMIRLLNTLEITIDPDKRDSIMIEIIPICEMDMPITILAPEVQTFVVHKRIKGLSSPYRAAPVWFMADLWIEEDSL